MNTRKKIQCQIQTKHLLYKGMLVVLVFCLALALGLGEQYVAAANDCTDKTANDPTNPFTPIDAWIMLPEGDQHWYAFRDEGDETDIMVRMTVLPANGAGFRVFTTAQVIAFLRGDELDAVGAGAPLPALKDNPYWTGNFVQSGIYYVLVEGNRREASNYMLSIRGSRVSFPLLSFSKPTPPTVDRWTICSNIDSVTPTPSVTPSTNTLSSPQTPLAAVGRLMDIVAGETHWYAFRDEGDDATIKIRADATPDQCLTFDLWTPGQLALWQRQQLFRPVGQGTVNDLLKVDLFWSGSFVKSGIYYIVVERDPMVNGDCTYQLRVTGDDVSLIIPPRNQ